MKKIMMILLGLMLLCGCSTKQTSAVAVLLKDETDSGLILFLDENNKTIDQLEVDYPAHLHYQGDILYYSYDSVNYNGVNMQSHKAVKGYEDVRYNNILYFCDDDSYIGYEYGDVYFVSNGEEVATLQIYVYAFVGNENYAYFVDTANRLYAYKDMEELYSANLYNPSFLALTIIDDKACVLTDDGVTVIEEDQIGTTYSYRKTFTINSVVGSHLYVSENDEDVCYKISFTSVGISLSEELDRCYYDDIIYNEVFKDYYDDGYYGYDYHSLRN